MNHPHPGEIIREDCIEAAALSITEVAERLGVTVQALSAILDGHANVSPDMARRLEERMKWSTAEMWLDVQRSYDLWQAREAEAKSDAARGLIRWRGAFAPKSDQETAEDDW